MNELRAHLNLFFLVNNPDNNNKAESRALERKKQKKMKRKRMGNV